MSFQYFNSQIQLTVTGFESPAIAKITGYKTKTIETLFAP